MQKAGWYWKRETLVYQSDLLTTLPGGLSAPRRYTIYEPSPDECWLWLEEVNETSKAWTLETYALAARHLGQFNGAYLVGSLVPEPYSWIGPSRLLRSLQRQRAQQLPHSFTETELGRALLQASRINDVEKWLAHRQTLRRAAEHLPTCLSHLDAFRRNLFVRQSATEHIETVAIDWAYTGYGVVGEEAGTLTKITLQWMDALDLQPKTLSEAVYDGYVQGLRDAGWMGEANLVRLGYYLSLANGVTWLLSIMDYLQDTENIAILESIIVQPMNVQIEYLAQLQPFLLEIGDEAVALLSKIA